jgi:lipopolysaccharide cholinephosphotransferase
MGRLVLSKLDKPSPQSAIKRMIKRVAMIFYKMLGSEYFIKKIQKQSYNGVTKNSQYIGCKAWCVYGERGVIPAKAFAQTMEIEFEGEMFPAPKDYDTYLTCLFGDYLPEPPKEKQKTHHDFKAYRLS